MTISLRRGAPTDLSLICDLIGELAAYEQLSHELRFDPATMGTHLFGERPMAEVLIGEIDGVAQGFALFFHNFSTFEGRPGLYLEDLFVRPTVRGLGLGKALLSHLARLAIERACARLEFSVLDWNTPTIGFYTALGARSMSDWTTLRIDDGALVRLAAG